MKKLRKALKWLGLVILLIVILLTALVFFAPEAVSENVQFQEISDLAANTDVIIIFNSGGWGYTPTEEAEDFASIIKGTQETLKDLELSSIVIPYNRTEDSLLGRAFGFKDFLNRFQFSSGVLATEVELLAEKLPNKKIIITGLSFGGSLTKETMKKISNKTQIYAIAVGIPFWHQNDIETENTLQLGNSGRDSLIEGDVKILLSVWLKAPFKWLFSRTTGKNLTFTEAMHVPGHDYFWSSQEVGPKIVFFIQDRLKY